MENNRVNPETDILQREEDCRKVLKTVAKAMVMRVLVLGILVWVALRNGMAVWVTGILALVGIINLTGILPLWTEWKKQRHVLKAIIAEAENE